MKTRVWLIALALISVFVINEVHSDRQQRSALRSEIAQLRVQQDRLVNQAVRAPVIVRTQPAGAPAAVAAAPAQVSAAAAAAASEARPDDAETRGRRWAQEAQASLDAVESAFVAEPTDDTWARAARAALHDRLTAAAHASLSSVGDVACKSSICRVEVVHRDAEASRQFADAAFSTPGDRMFGDVFVTPPQATSDGRYAAVMYLGREGTSLLR